MSDSKATQPLATTRPPFANNGQYNPPSLEETVLMALVTLKGFEDKPVARGKVTVTIHHLYGDITITI